MKTIRHLPLMFAGLCAALLHLAVPAARAADANPPGKLTYQGFLTDQNGLPLGNASPINTNIIFRIYTNATLATGLKWSELQTVTIDKGHFSVLLGEGSVQGTEPNTNNLTSVFTGNDASDRFMEITVGSTLIAPRLQFQPAPYAMLASGARQLIDSAGNAVMTASSGAAAFTGNVTASGFTGSGANLTALNPASIASGTVSNALTLNNTGNSFSGSGANLTALNASQLTTGTVPDARLSGTYSSALTLNNTVNSFKGNFTGNVGIGITSPLAPLHISETTGTANGANAGSLILDHENTGGASSIVFRSKNNRGSDYAFIQYQDDTNIGGAGETSLLTIGVQNDVTDHIALMPGGNVGIGTTTPLAKLNVQADATGTYASDSGQLIISGSSSNKLRLGLMIDTTAQVAKIQGGNSGIGTLPLALNAGGGNVGIGTTTPSAPLSVTGTGSYDINVFTQGVHMGADGGSVGIELVGKSGASAYIDFKVSNTAQDYGARLIYSGDDLILAGSGGTDLYCNQNAYAKAFNLISDARIKDILGRSRGSLDLNTLLALQVTDYRLKEGRTVSPKVEKKLIAQEVESVFPQAVSKKRGFIPDIRQNAVFENGWLKLKTDLKAGERVRLLVGDNQAEYDVLEVNDSGFRTALTTEAREVFVYGREVKDFRHLDYNAIAMLNVSATQELARQVEALRKSEARVAELELKVSHLAELEQKLTRMDALERKLADLEKLVARVAEPRKEHRPAAQAPASEVKAEASR